MARLFGHTGRSLASLCLFIGFIGFVVIVAYSWGSSGSHVRYACVALVVAFGVLGAGALFGFLFGIPKFVSSGQLRLTQPASADGDGQAGQGSQAGNQAGAQSFTPSTNLAEVSDWLTKLLLGAGLVSLTRLGRPLGHLIDTIASGIGGDSATNGAPKVMAGGILATYLVLGFLVGYVSTTLWYGRKLGEVTAGAGSTPRGSA